MNIRPATSPRGRGQRGQATIEMLGILPIAILVAGIILELFLIGYAAVSAESAARQAAREVSRGTSAHSAERRAERGVPGVFEANVHAGHGAVALGEEPGVSSGGVTDQVSAEARVKVPFLGFGVKGLNLTVTRYATMPNMN